MLKQILKLFSIFGIVLFLYYFLQLGPVNIWLKIRQLSVAKFLILLGLRVLYWLIRSVNWSLVLRTMDETPGFSKVFFARLGSHSVGFLTPAAKVGGELVKIFLLGDIDKRKLTASVIIDKMIEYYGSIIMVSIGVVLAVSLPGIGTGIKSIMFGLTILLIGILFFFFRKQKDGFLMWFRNRIRFGKRYFSDKESDIKITDSYISVFYRDHTGTYYLILIGSLVNYALWSFEIYITLSFLGSTHITIFNGFLIATLGTFAFIFPLLPGSVGMFEATYLALFELLGIVPLVGLGYIIIRRILGLLLAGAGLFPVVRSGFHFGKRDSLP